MSSSMAFRRSPKPGAFTAATFRPPRSLFTTNVASASPSMSSAMMTSGRPDWNHSFQDRQQRLQLGELSHGSECTGSRDHTVIFSAVGHEVRGRIATIELHTFNNVQLAFEGFASSTVMTPSLPTFCMACAIMAPTSASPLAEIVPTCAISSDVFHLLRLLLHVLQQRLQQQGQCRA